jgi:hypothetical protein
VRMRRVAVFVQRTWRGKIQKRVDSATRIQSWFRGSLIRHELRIRNRAAAIIQKSYRDHLAWKGFQTANAAAVRIQALARGHLARKHAHEKVAEIRRNIIQLACKAHEQSSLFTQTQHALRMLAKGQSLSQVKEAVSKLGESQRSTCFGGSFLC